MNPENDRSRSLILTSLSRTNSSTDPPLPVFVSRCTSVIFCLDIQSLYNRRFVFGRLQSRLGVPTGERFVDPPSPSTDKVHMNASIAFLRGSTACPRGSDEAIQTASNTFCSFRRPTCGRFTAVSRFSSRRRLRLFHGILHFGWSKFVIRCLQTLRVSRPCAARGSPAARSSASTDQMQMNTSSVLSDIIQLQTRRFRRFQIHFVRFFDLRAVGSGCSR